MHFILSKLLILDNYVKIERLSERMYVSDTTVKKDLKVIRNELDKYELQLISSPYYGLKIEGSEFQKDMPLQICCSINLITNTHLIQIKSMI